MGIDKKIPFFSVFYPLILLKKFYNSISFHLTKKKYLVYNTDMIQYNLNLLRNLFEDFSYLIKTTISFFDDNFLPTSVHSEDRRENHLCSLIKNSWNCRHNCTVSDEQCFERFRNGESFFYYHCHFGLIEMAFRFSVNNVTYGYVIIGPFRDQKNSKATVEAIKRLCTDEQLLEKTLQTYQKIPTFSLEKFYAIKNISFSIFDYAKNHNIISEKSNIFSEQIEPYILSHLQDTLTIEGLCKTFFLTQKQLYNVFEKNTHKTPKRYINEQRVYSARHLIITTNLPLSEIAASVGVPDYNYFIKIFKSYDGHTPMHYRKH